MGQSSFPDLSALVTCNLYTRRSSELEEASSELEKASSELEEASSEIEEASVFLDMSPPVTYTLSFAKSRAVCRSADSRYRRGISFIQTCQHMSHTHSALRKLRAIYRRFLVK
ncbi:hypothetical protein ACFXTN_042700 [Malus domestica]